MEREGTAAADVSVRKNGGNMLVILKNAGLYTILRIS